MRMDVTCMCRCTSKCIYLHIVVYATRQGGKPPDFVKTYKTGCAGTLEFQQTIKSVRKPLK